MTDEEWLEKATLVEDYTGVVYLDGVGGGGYGEGYFTSADALAEHLEAEEIEGHEFAFCCKAKKLVRVNYERIFDEIIADSYESACDDLEGVEEFTTAIATFNEANKHLLNWDEDHTRKVRIPKLG